MKRKNDKVIKQNDQQSAIEIYKKRQQKFVDEIHNKFIYETLEHCEDYHKARSRLEEKLDENQKTLFNIFLIIAEMESRDRESELIKYLLDYLFEKIMEKGKLEKAEI